MEPTISDPTVIGADGHARRHPERGTAERARDAQHPRRALGHLQGRVRRASVDGAAAARRAAGVRGVPAAARRARARRRARRAVRPQSGSGDAADVLRRRCRSRIRSTRRTCGRRRTATSPSRWTCRRSTRRSSRGCAPRARSSTRSRSRTSSTPAPAIPAGRAQSRTNSVAGGQAISAWAGQACNPYDTERVPRGSSSGSGVAVVGEPRRPSASASRPAPRARGRRRATASRRC